MQILLVITFLPDKCIQNSVICVGRDVHSTDSVTVCIVFFLLFNILNIWYPEFQDIEKILVLKHTAFFWQGILNALIAPLK